MDLKGGFIYSMPVAGFPSIEQMTSCLYDCIEYNCQMSVVDSSETFYITSTSNVSYKPNLNGWTKSYFLRD